MVGHMLRLCMSAFSSISLTVQTTVISFVRSGEQTRSYSLVPNSCNNHHCFTTIGISTTGISRTTPVLAATTSISQLTDILFSSTFTYSAPSPSSHGT